MCTFECPIYVCTPHSRLVPEEEGVAFPGTVVTGSCEPPDVGAANQAQVFCKSRKCS